MKLYLASYGLPNIPELEQLVGKKLPQMKIGYILNAMDDKSPEEYLAKHAEWHAYWGERGAQLTDLDLMKIDEINLNHILLEFDLLWAKGGNTYYLRHAMRVSGFDRIIRGVLEAGVTYGGDSAGAIVAGPSIKYLESADDPAGLQQITYEGLDLTPYVLMPHWRNLDFHAVTVHSKHLLEQDGYEVRTITDQQARVISGDSDKLVQMV